MADGLSLRELALRKLPLPYSLALRLRDAEVAAEVVCQYVDVEQTALHGFYRIAEAKLVAAQNTIGTSGCAWQGPRGEVAPRLRQQSPLPPQLAPPPASSPQPLSVLPPSCPAAQTLRTAPEDVIPAAQTLPPTRCLLHREVRGWDRR
jgi:hypothetical protein